jgi:hypothetical protein
LVVRKTHIIISVAFFHTLHSSYNHLWSLKFRKFKVIAYSISFKRASILETYNQQSNTAIKSIQFFWTKSLKSVTVIKNMEMYEVSLIVHFKYNLVKFSGLAIPQKAINFAKNFFSSWKFFSLELILKFSSRSLYFLA